MEAARTGQVTRSAADIYQEFFVPCLFGEWAPRVVRAAGVAPGDQVLDVACGTGVLVHAAAVKAGPSGSVVGLDINPDMLAVAARAAPPPPPRIEWRAGRAEALPFPDASFDRVVSQFGLMFFDDWAAALAEMWRVLRPGGTLVVAVWGALPATPGYAAMVDLLARLFGDETADALRAPYCLGDPDALKGLVDGAGIPNAKISSVEGHARFPSIDAWVHVDIRGWTLADSIDDAQYERLRTAANRDLGRFLTADGSVSFSHDAYFITAAKG